jgi:KaiC/GvpD/RAD55 family RecA-like ATPase
MEFWDVLTKINPDGEPIELGYPYGAEGHKIRRLNPENKRDKYTVRGSIKDAPLLGIEKFPPGCAQAITIVEGEGDLLAFTEVFGRKAPVVCLKNGAASARRDIVNHRDHINSFEKIYLALDGDEAGQNAVRAIAGLFDANKLYHVRFEGGKDPLEFVETGLGEQFKRMWWNSKRFLPDNIKSTFDEFDKVLDEAKNEPGHPWPFDRLSYLTGGIKLGRSYLVSGLEGIGKTEFFHAVENHLLSTTDDNIAIIHIEEPLDENLKRKAGFVLKQPVHFADSTATPNDIKEAYRKLFRRSDRVHFYNHFGSDDPDTILDVVRSLVVVGGCKYVFLDNITFLVTGRTEEDERKTLDYLSSKLEMMVKELKFALVFISHENDFEKTRGSRNISKVADVWINLKRNIEDADPILRNVMALTIKKGRGCRGTGPAGHLVLDTETYILKELKDEVPVEKA